MTLRDTASDALPRLLTYKEYATHPRTGLLPCLTRKYRALVSCRRTHGAQLCQHPPFGSLRMIKYAPTSQSALNCKKAAQKSGFPLACARLLLSPTKRARFDPTENSFGGDPTLRRFAGTPTEGCFRVLHPNIALSELAFERASLNTPFLIRRRNYAPQSQTFTAGAVAAR